MAQSDIEKLTHSLDGQIEETDLEEDHDNLPDPDFDAPDPPEPAGAEAEEDEDEQGDEDEDNVPADDKEEPLAKKGGPPETIPYPRFAEVIKERNATKDHLTAMEGRLAEMQALIEKVTSTPPPDMDEDPEAAATYYKEQAEATAAKLSEHEKIAGESQAVNAKVEAAIDYLEPQEIEFEAVTPVYRAAVDHAKGVAAARLIERGYPETIAVTTVNNRIIEIVEEYKGFGGNAAKALYAMAVNDYGFKPGGNGTSDQRKTAIETNPIAGAKRNRSVAGRGSSGTEIKSIDQMSDKEFAEYMAGHREESDPLRA